MWCRCGRPVWGTPQRSTRARSSAKPHTPRCSSSRESSQRAPSADHGTITAASRAPPTQSTLMSHPSRASWLLVALAGCSHAPTDDLIPLACREAARCGWVPRSLEGDCVKQAKAFLADHCGHTIDRAVAEGRLAYDSGALAACTAALDLARGRRTTPGRPAKAPAEQPPRGENSPTTAITVPATREDSPTTPTTVRCPRAWGKRNADARTTDVRVFQGWRDEVEAVRTRGAPSCTTAARAIDGGGRAGPRRGGRPGRRGRRSRGERQRIQRKTKGRVIRPPAPESSHWALASLPAA